MFMLNLYTLTATHQLCFTSES